MSEIPKIIEVRHRSLFDRIVVWLFNAFITVPFILMLLIALVR